MPVYSSLIILTAAFALVVTNAIGNSKINSLGEKIDLPAALEYINQAPRLKVETIAKEVNQTDRKLLLGELAPQIEKRPEHVAFPLNPSALQFKL